MNQDTNKHSASPTSNRLYLVALPIGNLGDITRRAIDTLRSVDLIFCEDTRHTQKLLNHLGIKKRLISYYRPREEQKAPALVRLLANQTGALVTDSGTPLLSDPGFALVREAIAAGIEIVPLPGPTALVPALVASGLDIRSFLFLGFPPRKPGELKRFLEDLAPLPYTLVFYESPRRVDGLLKAAGGALGDREVCLAKEISKRHEGFVRGRLAGIREHPDMRVIRGEMVVVIEGAGAGAESRDAPHLRNIDDLYAYFWRHHRISKNHLKSILMRRGPKRGDPERTATGDESG